MRVRCNLQFKVGLARGLTTLLCCGWGYSFAYSFFRCIQDRSGPLVCAAAALPLAAVWASLERKRWGRLVLISQSLLAQALFALILSIVSFTNRVRVMPSERNIIGYFVHALRLFGERPEITLAVLILAVATSIWFCMPWVRAEYDQRKKPLLTPGQRVIAITVVSLWCVTMVATPTLPESRSPHTPLKTPRRLTLRY